MNRLDERLWRQILLLKYKVRISNSESALLTDIFNNFPVFSALKHASTTLYPVIPIRRS
jgi:hypothetical protein